MNRRRFLQGLLGTAAVAIAPAPAKDAWFLVDDGLPLYAMSHPIGDFTTENLRYRAYERWDYGWHDMRRVRWPMWGDMRVEDIHDVEQFTRLRIAGTDEVLFDSRHQNGYLSEDSLVEAFNKIAAWSRETGKPITVRPPYTWAFPSTVRGDNEPFSTRST